MRDERDRRVRRIVITPRGRDVLADLEARVRAAEDELFKDMPADERATFQAQALKLAMSIHATDPSIDPCIAVLDVMAQTSGRSATR